MVMTRGKWLRSIDCARIKEAIQQAERQTSGEICVSISSLFWGKVNKAAEKAFVRLGMTRTKRRNGVLLFVVPARRKLVILGDRGIHEKVGAEFWQQVVDRVTAHFRAGDYTDGLLLGIEEISQQLARHFPFDEADVNELSDVIDFGVNPSQAVEKRL
jgi:uncharacterized membrane protein